jgi:hypothetical protein
MLRLVALVITDISVELSASIIRVTRNVELGTTLLVTTNLRQAAKKYKCFVFLRSLASVAKYD